MSVDTSTVYTASNVDFEPKVAWMPNRTELADTSRAWTKTPGSMPALRQEALVDVLKTQHPWDSHFVTYILIGGVNASRQPRVKKEDLKELRERGCNLEHHLMMADVDQPDHEGARMTPETIQDAQERLSSLPSIGFYSTRAGFRIVQPFTRPISSEHYEAEVMRWLPQIKALMGDGWVVDFKCKDWTRLFRCPFVRRNGVMTESTVDFSRMAGIEPGPVPPPVVVTPRLPRVATAREARESIVDRARKYVGRITTPTCGTSSCNARTFKAALHIVKGFDLDEETAMDLLVEWAGGMSDSCDNKKPSSLRKAIEGAAKTDVETGFHLKDDVKKHQRMTPIETPNMEGISATSDEEDDAISAFLRPEPAVIPAAVVESFVTAAAAAAGRALPLGERVAAVTKDITDDNLREILKDIEKAPAAQKFGLKAAIKKRLEMADSDIAKFLADGDDDGEKGSPILTVVRKLKFFRILTGRVFTSIEHEAIPVDSERYVQWVSYAVLRTFGFAAPKDKIRTATTAVVGPVNKLPLGDAAIRYAFDKDGSIWVDLADKEGRTVHVTEDSIKVVAKCDCKITWYRPDGTMPMPLPVIPSSAAECKAQWDAFWNFQQRDVVEDRVAAFAWMMSSARPMLHPVSGVLTRFSVGAMTGEHGGGKTSAMEVFRTIIDDRRPGSVNLPPSNKIDDMTIHCEQVACLAIDNASHLTSDHSDHLCRIATGAGSVKRSLYCDRDLSVFMCSRPVIINGICDVVTRDDLMDRSILIRQSRPKVRKTESVMAREFAAIYPKVFGAILFCMMKALGAAENTTVDSSIRMVEAAKWAASAEVVAGFESGDVSKCYVSAKENATAVAAEDSFLCNLLSVVPVGVTTKTAAEILTMIEENWEADHPKKRQPEKWPTEPRGLRAALDRRKSALEALGVVLTYSMGRTAMSSSARLITLTRTAPTTGLRLVVDNTVKTAPDEMVEDVMDQV